jgi:hypothetical protein
MEVAWNQVDLIGLEQEDEVKYKKVTDLFAGSLAGWLQ